MGPPIRRIALAALAACAGCGSILGDDVLTFRAPTAVPDASASDGAAEESGTTTTTDAGADTTMGRRDAQSVACGDSLDCGGSCCAEADTQHCIDRGGACSGAVLECTGSPECPRGTVCCLRSGATGASSRCESSCLGGRTMCNNKDSVRDHGCERKGCSSDDVADWNISGEFELCPE